MKLIVVDEISDLITPFEYASKGELTTEITRRIKLIAPLSNALLKLRLERDNIIASLRGKKYASNTTVERLEVIAAEIDDKFAKRQELMFLDNEGYTLNIWKTIPEIYTVDEWFEARKNVRRAEIK